MIAYSDPTVILLITRLQFRMRQVLIRKKIIEDPKNSDGNRKYYFQDCDYYETLNFKNKINLSKDNQILETRRHTYKKTQATYSGEWLGGFRHGNGTIVFKDGTSFVGKWQYGCPHGHGKFMM